MLDYYTQHTRTCMCIYVHIRMYIRICTVHLNYVAEIVQCSNGLHGSGSTYVCTHQN